MRDTLIAILSSLVLFAVLLHLPPPEVKTVQLNEQDNGASIHLKTGQELVIRVQTPGGQPAVWKLVEADRNVLRWVAPEYQEPEPVRRGDPIDVLWHFQALDPGETPIRLCLQSASEETSAQIDRTFDVLVVVE